MEILKELSFEFDIYYNNIMSGVAPGINDYEKSVFLTRAQDELIKEFFSPKKNAPQEGVGDSIERDYIFDTLLKTKSIERGTIDTSFYKNTISFNKPNDVLYELSFKLRNNNNERIVIPIKDSELNRLQSKPYKEPFKGYAYKINNKENNKKYEVIVHRKDYSLNWQLLLRYIKKPEPIILVNLSQVEGEYGLDSNTLTIRGERVASLGSLTNAYSDILERAVQLAKIHYDSNPESAIQYNTNTD